LSRFNPEFFVVAKPAPQWPFWHPQNTPKTPYPHTNRVEPERFFWVDLIQSRLNFSGLTCSRAGSKIGGKGCLRRKSVWNLADCWWCVTASGLKPLRLPRAWSLGTGEGGGWRS